MLICVSVFTPRISRDSECFVCRCGGTNLPYLCSSVQVYLVLVGTLVLEVANSLQCYASLNKPSLNNHQLQCRMLLCIISLQYTNNIVCHQKSGKLAVVPL